ncbi:MAG TPA: hypothetical protein VGD94_06555 [Vicinamibacterales bacterium]
MLTDIAHDPSIPTKPATHTAPLLTRHEVLACATAWVSAGIFGSLWFADPDLWGHLRFGLDAVRDRVLTPGDPYSFTADVPWINHEWLSEVILGVVYQWGGITGLMLSKAFVTWAAFGLMASHLRYTATPWRWWLAVLAIVACGPMTITWRPQVWSVLALTCLAASTSASIRLRLITWPVLFVLWANLHGGWIVGLGVAAAWSAGRIIESNDWRSALPVGLSVIATLATPYGLDLWLFIWHTVGFDRGDIGEWQSTWAQGGKGLLWLVGVSACALLWRRGVWTWSAALPVLMLAAASLRVGRLTGLFAIVVVMLLGSRLRGPAPAFPRALWVMLGIGAMVPTAFIMDAQTECVSFAGTRPPDAAAAGALIGTTGRLMVPFDWGQYAIWHFSPALRVSFDGRRETVYSAERIAEQHQLTSGDLSMVPFIEEHAPEYVWVPRPEGELLATYLVEIGYREDVRTEHSVILTRSDLPVISAAAPMSACFP